MNNYFKLFSFIGISLFLLSCNNDEPAPADDLIGTWTATDVSVDITYNGQSAYDYYISQGATQDEAEWTVGYQTRGYSTYVPITLTLKENGVAESVSGAIGDADGYYQEGSWSINEERTILTLWDLEAEIHTLTNKNLSFTLTFESTEYSEENMTYDIKLDYSK